MRIALLPLLASAVLVGEARAPAASQVPPPVLAKAIYVVHPDPRLCPSPRCGGYWIGLANHARTRCADGLFRPRCYVAVALDSGSRQPRGVPAESLVEATLGLQSFGDLGELGALFVTDAWTPVVRAKVAGMFVRLRDTGIRCVRAPCNSIRLGRLNIGAHTVLVSSLDLGPVRTGPTRKRAEAALATPEGLLAAGRTLSLAGGGHLFRADEIYLKP
jgi:Domain of unknown function (DUF6748)